jgi:hypothetical protein
MRADGSDSSRPLCAGHGAGWIGTRPPTTLALGGCSAVTLTFHSAQMSLNGGTLTAQGSGSATGCGTTSSVTLTFVGS